ncbi:MAG: hypothetical protein AAB375_01795 [Patescibacteria group bacterium]
MEPQTSPFNPVPTPAPVVPSVTLPAKSPRSLRALWIALIAVVVLAGVAYGWMKFYLPSPAALESASPSPSANVIAGWKTYSNSQFGFSLRLPPSWSDYTVYVRTEPLPGSLDDVADVQINYNASVQQAGQTIVINVFTLAQWAAELQKDQPHPQELGRSIAGRTEAFVFATPFRFESSGLPGESDIPRILETFRAAQ